MELIKQQYYATIPINMNIDKDQYYLFKRILFSDALNHGHALVQS